MKAMHIRETVSTRTCNASKFIEPRTQQLRPCYSDNKLRTSRIEPQKEISSSSRLYDSDSATGMGQEKEGLKRRHFVVIEMLQTLQKPRRCHFAAPAEKGVIADSIDQPASHYPYPNPLTSTLSPTLTPSSPSLPTNPIQTNSIH